MLQQKAKNQDPPLPRLDGVRLFVKGRIPSKKRGRNLFVRGGKLVNIPSKKYEEWHKEAIVQICDYKCRLLKDIHKVTLSFWAPDKRASDLTNKAESIMDLLVDAGILEDDNWWLVGKIELVFMGVNVQNPRCEIYIEQNIFHHE